MCSVKTKMYKEEKKNNVMGPLMDDPGIWKGPRAMYCSNGE